MHPSFLLEEGFFECTCDQSFSQRGRGGGGEGERKGRGGGGEVEEEKEQPDGEWWKSLEPPQNFEP
jgi:hypothetical protein